jgi:hypothetical protein
MKRAMFFFCLIYFFYACQSKSSRQTNTDTVSDSLPKDASIQKITLSPQERIKGFWVGMFGENKINIAITDLAANGTATGYSVVAGNERTFTGTYKNDGNVFVFDVKEPETNPYDGHFEFSIDLNQQETDTTGVELRGKWTPFDKKLPAKTYTLAKREFRYNPEAGNYPETARRLLQPEDLENRFKEDLRIMRNEIFARHGYSFKLKDIRKHFDQQDWYMPVTTDVRKNLSDIELKNAALIKRYEQYAEEYYDEFGR